jgi:glycosyltransferase involved in cell wall biosynthesis
MDASPAGGVGLAVPFFDEEAVATRALAALSAALAQTGRPWRLFAVNNGSRDRTGAALEAFAAACPHVQVIHLRENAGYGGGIRVGLDAAQAQGWGWIGWAWGDHQVDPEVIPSLLRACEEGADLAKVRRVHRFDGLQRRVITRAYAAAGRAMGARSDDLNGCPKLWRAAALARLDLRASDWFLDPEAMLRAEALGMVIAELPCAMRPRDGGQSKVRWPTVARFAGQLLAWRAGWRP